jgi:hypothetical protein
VTCPCTLTRLCPEAQRLQQRAYRLSAFRDGSEALQEATRALWEHRREAGVLTIEENPHYTGRDAGGRFE